MNLNRNIIWVFGNVAIIRHSGLKISRDDAFILPSSFNLLQKSTKSLKQSETEKKNSTYST